MYDQESMRYNDNEFLYPQQKQMAMLPPQNAPAGPPAPQTGPGVPGTSSAPPGPPAPRPALPPPPAPQGAPQGALPPPRAPMPPQAPPQAPTGQQNIPIWKTRDFNLNLLRGGGAMMEAAGKPGGTFFGSLGTGTKTFAKGYQDALQKGRELDIKDTAAKARLAKANRGSISNIEKIVNGFELKRGDPGYQKKYQEVYRALHPDKDLRSNIRKEVDDMYPDLKPGSEEHNTKMRETFARKHPEPTQWIERTVDEQIKRLGLNENSKEAKLLRKLELNKALHINTGDSDTIKLAKILNKAKGKGREFALDTLNKRAAEQIKVGLGSMKPMRAVVSLSKQINSGAATGGGVETLTAWESLSTVAGFDLPKVMKKLGFEDLGKLSDREFIRAQTNTLAQSILATKAFGHNPSNKDLNIILQMLPSLGLDEVSNARISEGLFKGFMINLKDGEAALKRVESTAYGKDLPESRESLRVAEQIEELKQQRDNNFLELRSYIRGITPDQVRSSAPGSSIRKRTNIYNAIRKNYSHLKE